MAAPPSDKPKPLPNVSHRVSFLHQRKYIRHVLCTTRPDNEDAVRTDRLLSDFASFIINAVSVLLPHPKGRGVWVWVRGNSPLIGLPALKPPPQNIEMHHNRCYPILEHVRKICETFFHTDVYRNMYRERRVSK
jgi:hypothetical protein